jgi:transcriptional regulator with XRE-family HTH domain
VGRVVKGTFFGRVSFFVGFQRELKMSEVMVDESSVALGRLIRDARNKKNLSQADVGHAIGTGQQTIAKIESGQSGFGSPFIWKTLDYLEIRHEVAQLVGEAERAAGAPFKRAQPIERARRLGGGLPIYRADELSTGGEIAIGAEPVEYRPWPEHLVQAGYAVYMAGMSMFPEYKPGETMIVNPVRPPTLQHAHVFRHADEASGRAVVGILRRMDALNWYVQQWNLSDDVVLKRSDWPRAHMVTMKSVEPI